MTKPNIVLFFPDQHRGDAMGCDGNPAVQTPNLDRLADSGVLFERCYTSSPLCMPARASLITGRCRSMPTASGATTFSRPTVTGRAMYGASATRATARRSSARPTSTPITATTATPGSTPTSSATGATRTSTNCATSCRRNAAPATTRTSSPSEDVSASTRTTRGYGGRVPFGVRNRGRTRRRRCPPKSISTSTARPGRRRGFAMIRGIVRSISKCALPVPTRRSTRRPTTVPSTGRKTCLCRSLPRRRNRYRRRSRRC